MAFTVEQIKNLALMELNHETISDWTDSTNTDIEIINTQYALAKPVALSMYQWSWAFRYTTLVTTINVGNYDYVYTMPNDWKANTDISALYEDSGMTTPITDYIFDNVNGKLYVNNSSVYVAYTTIGGTPGYETLVGAVNTGHVEKYKRSIFLPADFIGYLACYTDKEFRILADYVNVGNIIYTNSEKLYIKYIANVDESVFPAEFVDWFKIFLAQRLNGYLNGDMQRQQLLTGEEPFFFRKAKNIDSKRNKHESLDGNPLLWIRGKLGGGM